MKKELLEYLVRECVKEVLESMPDPTQPETIGAPAPPAGGQGTADQPALPQDTSAGPTFTVGTKGVWYVNPKNVSKPMQLNVSAQNPANLERQLYRTAATSAGPRVKIAAETLREVPKALTTGAPLFLFVGQRNPDDPADELYLLPAKTYDQAKAGSVGPEASAEHPSTAIGPDVANVDDPTQLATAMQAKGQTPADIEDPDDPEKMGTPDLTESSRLKKLVSMMIKESISEFRNKKK